MNKVMLLMVVAALTACGPSQPSETVDALAANPDRIKDAIWSVGIRLTPTPDSFLTLRYGHRGGFDSPSLEAGIQLGGFTRLTASYVEQLATAATADAEVVTRLREAGAIILGKTAVPEMMLVAGPVRDASAISRTGRKLPAV